MIGTQVSLQMTIRAVVPLVQRLSSFQIMIETAAMIRIAFMNQRMMKSRVEMNLA